MTIGSCIYIRWSEPADLHQDRGLSLRACVFYIERLYLQVISPDFTRPNHNMNTPSPRATTICLLHWTLVHDPCWYILDNFLLRYVQNSNIASTFAPPKMKAHEKGKQEEWQEGEQGTHLGRQVLARDERHRLRGRATHQVWRGIVVPAEH